MRHFSSNNLRDEKKGPIKFLFLFFSWCVFSQGLSLFLVPLRPVCNDCQKVAPFLHFFPAAHWQELCATFSKHLALCASPKRNDSKTSWPLRLDNAVEQREWTFSETKCGRYSPRQSAEGTLVLISGFAWNISNVWRFSPCGDLVQRRSKHSWSRAFLPSDAEWRSVTGLFIRKKLKCDPSVFAPSNGGRDFWVAFCLRENTYSPVVVLALRSLTSWVVSLYHLHLLFWITSTTAMAHQT